MTPEILSALLWRHRVNSAISVWRVEEMAEAAIGRLGGPRAARSSDPMLCKGALNPEEECWLSVLPLFSDYMRCCQKEQVGCEHDATVDATFDCEPGHYFQRLELRRKFDAKLLHTTWTWATAPNHSRRNIETRNAEPVDPKPSCPCQGRGICPLGSGLV